MPIAKSESEGSGVVLTFDQRFGYGTVRSFFGAEGRTRTLGSYLPLAEVFEARSGMIAWLTIAVNRGDKRLNEWLDVGCT